MGKFGLYSVDDSKTLGESGVTWKRHALYHDGQKIASSIKESNDLGIIAVGDKLLLNGEIIAKATEDSSDGITSEGKFGDVDLLGYETCINITKSNYEKLYRGELVVGYKQYDSQAIYNIVPSVADAPIVKCVKPSKGHDFLYNNINPDAIPHNILTDDTFTANRTPQLSVHDVSLRLTIKDGVCEPVTLMYMVDTKDLQKLHWDKFDDTFTVIVKDNQGRELYKNTTFAGEFWIEFDLFKYNTLAEGETYFSIECIDNHGVGSVVQFIEVGVFNEEVPNYYDVESRIGIDITATRVNGKITELSFEHDNRTYTLYLDDDTELYAYRNKLSLTALFAKAKDAGYNGVKLYNADGDNPTIYYVTYHRDISGNQDYDNPQFGSQEYYVGQVEGYAPKQGSTKEQPGHLVGNLIPIVQGEFLNFDNKNIQIAETPLDFIKRDGAELHRVTEDVSTEHEGKIWVWWRDSGSNWSDDRKNEFPNVRVYDPDTELCCRDYKGNSFGAYSYYGLRTIPYNATNIIANNGYHYFVKNTESFGDIPVFPDNFTVDMNGVVLQLTQNIGVGSGRIILFENNYNTHLKNGVISGLYKDYDFKSAFLARGSDTLGISEGLSNITTSGCRYCSIENVESRYSVGYDCVNYTDGVPRTIHSMTGSLTQNSFSFGNSGYISLNGDVKSALPIRETVYSGHTDKTYYEGLVYDEAYQAWNFRFDGEPTDECYFSSLYLVPFMSGKEHEFFIHFYKQVDGEYKYISTIKSAFYHVIKKPHDATHFRISAYGIVAETDGAMQSVIATHFNHQINAAFYDFDINCFGNKQANDILYKSDWVHHTKSTGFSSETNGVTWDNCLFEGVACIPRIDWFVTKLLGATEDGRVHTNLVTIKSCRFNRLYSDSTAPENLTDTTAFSFAYGRNVTVINNVGLSILKHGNVYDMYCGNNIMRSVKITMMSPIPHCHFVSRNNSVTEEYKDTSVEADTPVDYAKSPNSTYVNSASKYNGLRRNNCDEAIDGHITMSEMFSVKPSNNTLSLRKHDVRYKRSNIGNRIVNQTFDNVVTYYEDYYYFNCDGHYEVEGSATTALNNGTYKPVIVGRIHNPVDVWRIYIDGVAWEAALANYSHPAQSTIEENIIKYIKHSYLQPLDNYKPHDIYCNYSRVSATNGAIQITAWNKLIVPVIANTLGNASNNSYRQRYAFDGTDGVLVFMGATPPNFEIGYRVGNTHVVYKATSIDQVEAHLSKIKVPVGSADTYKAMLKSISRNSVDQSFLNDLVEECTYEELIAEYPDNKVTTQAGSLRYTSVYTYANGYSELYNNNQLGNTDLSSLMTSLKRNCHTALPIDIRNCTRMAIDVEEGETAYAFFYDKDLMCVSRKTLSIVDDKAVVDFGAIPSTACYVKFQISKDTDYGKPRRINIFYEGLIRQIKNLVPSQQFYGVFRFATTLPNTVDDGDRHFDTGTIKLPPNYSIDGVAVPIVIFLHGSSGVNEFFSKQVGSEESHVSEFLCNNGYAVASCSGVTDKYCMATNDDTYKGEGFAAPSYLLAIQHLIKYIALNYNVNTNKIYVLAKSAGGFTANLISQQVPFNVRAVGMFSPALSPMVSLSNHARNHPGAASMEAEQIGVDYQFTKGQFNDNDENAVLNNIAKWRTIDSFFGSTDFTNEEVEAVITTVYTNSSLTIPSNVVDMATKKQMVKIPTRLWISKYDTNVVYSNSELYSQMAGKYNDLFTLTSIDDVNNLDHHNICTKVVDGFSTPSYTTSIGVTINSFRGEEGVPNALIELVEYFNQY